METSRKKISTFSTLSMIAILIAVAIAIYFTGGYRGTDRSASISKTRVMFDTIVRISIEGRNGQDFEPAFHEVWTELSKWESELDIYAEESILSVVNRSETSVILTDRTSKALKLGFEAILWSGGNFDIRIGGLALLWDFAGDGNVPSEREISEAIDLMHHPIRIQNDTLIKSGLSPRIDLGGLAKGMAADAIYAILDTIPGIERFIIDLGGNIRAKSSDSSSFAIGIQDPRSPNEIAAKFKLDSGFSCATAGDYQRYFVEDGVRYHHILDPATGRPARRCSAVTVIASNGATADILSTALFVMGPDNGMRFLSSRRDIEAVFFDSTGSIIVGNLDSEGR